VGGARWWDDARRRRRWSDKRSLSFSLLVLSLSLPSDATAFCPSSLAARQSVRRFLPIAAAAAAAAAAASCSAAAVEGDGRWCFLLRVVR